MIIQEAPLEYSKQEASKKSVIMQNNQAPRQIIMKAAALVIITILATTTTISFSQAKQLHHTATNLCTIKPSICQNGATCVNKPGGDYQCICVNGWEGQNCTENVDDCSTAACENGAKCIDQVGHFLCECPPGKTGLLCQLEDGCFNNPCHPNATCDTLPVDGRAICTCPLGFSGPDCKTDNDECAAGAPCEHGGVCVNIPGSYRCDCQRGFTGDRCEVNINECLDNPCTNGGTCLDEKGGFRCICLRGYEGERCEVNVDECAKNPCQNGATCKDEVNSFRCLCPAGFWGERCEYNTSNARPHVPPIDILPLSRQNPWVNCPDALRCWTSFSDGKCDQECNNPECLYDGKDCTPLDSKPSAPRGPPVSSNVCEASGSFCLRNYANGICDQECNTSECGWDGLDCEQDSDNIENSIVPSNTRAQGLLIIRVEPAIELGTDQQSKDYLTDLLRKLYSITKTVFKIQRYQTVDEGNGTEIELIADNRRCQDQCFKTTDLIAKFLTALKSTKSQKFNETLASIPQSWKLSYDSAHHNKDESSPQSMVSTIWVVVCGTLATMCTVLMVISIGNKQKVKEKAIVWFPEGFKPVLSSRNRDPTDRSKKSGRGVSTLQALGGNFFRGVKRNERNISTDPNGLHSTDIDRCTATPNGGGIYHEPYDYDQYGSTYNGAETVNDANVPMTPPPTKLNPLNIEGPHGLTPLMVASMGQMYPKDQLGLVTYGTTCEVNGSESSVTDLLNRGAQLNLTTKITGETALHLAARCGRADNANRLLAHCDSKDINAQDSTGRTPLHAAIAADSLGVFELLVRNRGTNLNAQTYDGTTPLILAAKVGNYDMLEELLQSDSDVTKSDANGKTALHWAAAVNNVDIIRRLLAERQTNKDAQDLAEETPLYLAAREGARGAVEMLLNHNANRDIKDQMDMSPIDIARARKHDDIVRLLEEHQPPTPRSVTTAVHTASNSLSNLLSPVSTSMMSPPTSRSLHHLASPTKTKPPQSLPPPPRYKQECQTIWGNNNNNTITHNNNNLNHANNNNNNHVVGQTHGLTEVYNVPCLKNYLTPSPDSPFSIESMASPPSGYQNLLSNQNQAGVYI